MGLDDYGYRVDRRVIAVCGDFEEIEAADRSEHWSLSPAERLRRAEFLRQIAFSPLGYDPATARVRRVLEVVELDRR